MSLSEKMFSRSNKKCPLRSDCKKQSDQQYFDSLFADEWEVFVIKHDNEGGKFDWFTQCCESVTTRYEKPNILSATCR